MDIKIDTDFFNENGFLVIPNFFSPEQLTTLQTEINNLIDNYEIQSGNTFKTEQAKQNNDDYFLQSGDKISFFLEDTAVDPTTGELTVPKREAFNKIAHALHDRNDIFQQFSYQPSLLRLSKILGFTIPQIVQSMFIFKSAKVGGQVYPHQDSTFVQSTPYSCIGFWVSLQDATKDNGCMWFVPGSHKAPIERTFNLNEDGTSCSFNIDGYKYDTTTAIPVEVKAGSLVLIHGSVIHYSLPNHSDMNRNAYSMHILEGKEGFTYPKTNWLRRPDDFPFFKFDEVTNKLYGQDVVDSINQEIQQLKE